MEWTKEKMDEAIAEIQSKAVTDADFRKKLLADPNAAIEEVTGMAIDPSYKIRIIEADPNYQATFFLPPLAADEFTADELDAVAGGSCAGFACGGNGCVQGGSK